ncbi:MAG: TonB-dependent hemoglobin/transferrin/lactoferrin family receptor [Xanthomonadaceae bacterium]|nr:TonB-dependent hemoglobin/transferrin/lactoferrin family receptor [Xanthomonadaceae bacterium]MCC7248931.1 TonB-dependent hemoglobin/transferrin/lactoferrin family receptor [Lysobacter sp.]
MPARDPHRRRMHRKAVPAVLSTAVALALCSAHACAAEDDARASDPRMLDRIVVIASKVPEPAGRVVGRVVAIERATLERQQVQDIADLVRYEPGIDALGDSARFGWQGFSIRGLDGNRVGMEIDGVPVAEAFSVGQFAAAGRDLVELDALQRVEILRGPASTLYGSDALAGVVAYRTRSPADLLALDDDAHQLGARWGASGRDDSMSRSVALAGRGGERFEAMVLASRRDGHAADNHSAAHPANPLDYRRDGLLAKLIWDGQGFGRWTATYDRGEGRARTDVGSLRFGPGRFSTTTDLRGDDRYRRERASLGAEWSSTSMWLDRAELLLYAQRSDTTQDTAQTRLADRTTRFPSLRLRRFSLEQNNTGIKWLGESRSGSEGDTFRHRHVFGIELSRTSFEGLRDGSEINLLTGASSNVVLGERFPVRDFPNSTARETGVFWQDEIGIGERFAVVPGLRWERYALDAQADAMFREDYPNVRVTDILRTAWTPKLGLRWQPSERSTFFAQYARGFRAPPFGDVNIGLSLTLLNYEVRPNPDLRPETSHGFEAGWRWRGEGLRLDVSAYRNRYRDLIDSRANLGIDPSSGALVFQSVNRARARIEGIEAEASWTPALAPSWEFRAAGAWARGRDLARDAPLNSVAPAKAVLGASWEPAASNWGVEAVATGVARQSALDESAGSLFGAPGHALLDVYAWWRPLSATRVNLAVQNLADRRYWDWNTVRGVSANAADIDFYTRPGRSVSLSVSFDW